MVKKALPENLQYFLLDCLEANPNYTTKSMFGGYGVYYLGKIFAIYAWDIIYMKVGDNNRQDYIDVESQQFVYDKKGTPCYLNYWQLPEELWEDREKLQEWVEKSLEVQR